MRRDGKDDGEGGAEPTAQLELQPEPEPEQEPEPEPEASTLAVAPARQVLLTQEHLQETDVEGCTPLHYSCYMGAARCCALLLQAKAEVNKKDAIDAGTALHFAAWKGDWPDIIQMLLEAGANRKLRNNYHKTPLEYAKDNRQTQTIALLKGGKGKKGKQKKGAKGGGSAIEQVLACREDKKSYRLKPAKETGDETVTLHIGAMAQLHRSTLHSESVAAAHAPHIDILVHQRSFMPR
jgi:hypothetical protein